MKIKSNHRHNINYQFGLALFMLIALFSFALSYPNHHHSNDSLDDSIYLDTATDDHSFNAELLELQINRDNFKKIEKKREDALQKGLLFTSRLDLVPGDIRIHDELYAVNLRLKGDLLDHLAGDKWSYRIELKKNESWKGMTEFSVHNSKARSHIAEWYMHQVFSNEGIITALYDFIALEENGKSKGVYAYEEHFTDELLLRNKRQIGPILKHNDDAYWENVQKDVKPFYWTKAMEIDLFNKNNSGDPDFMKSFEYAKSLLLRFLHSEIKASDIFDITKMAKYYALMELSHAFHAQQITNIRFYLNQTIGKLEPIAFDCFGEKLPKVTADWEAAGQGMNHKVSPREGYPYGGVYMHLLFQDKDFFREYMGFLDQYTRGEYLSRIKSQLENGASQREAFIRRDAEYVDYSFSFDQLFKKASLTRKKIFPLSNYSLKVFTKNDSRKDLAIQSFHYFPMEVIGFGNLDGITEHLSEPLFLEAFNVKTTQKTHSLNNTNEKEFLFYKTIGTDSIFQYRITKNKLPDSKVEAVQADLSYWFKNNLITQHDDTIILVNQKTVLSDYLIIPEEYIFLINPGQEIVFEEESGLISYSPIISKGMAGNRIRFIGTADAGQGIVSNLKSTFINCDFIDLSSVNYKGIDSKSGLSMSSSCTMANCSFDGSRGKYSVSMNHSSCTFENTVIKNSLWHGLRLFDSDGDMEKLSFHNIEGNALVVDNSAINLYSADFVEINGNAILASNSADIHIDSIRIKNSFQGLVSQNIDVINCDHAVFTNVQNGIVIKAPNTKRSSFLGESIVFKDVQTNVVQDLFSTIRIKGKQIKE